MGTFRKNLIFRIALIVCLSVSAIQLNAQKPDAVPSQRLTLLQYIIDDNRPVLVNLLTSSGLVPLLSGEEQYTLLAPPEEALKELKSKSPDEIKRILSGHILKGAYLEKDLKDGLQVKTLSGASVTVCRKDGTLLNGVRVSAPDNSVRNGVMHGLGGALAF